MALHTQKFLREYAERLESDTKEVEALYHDLLISVTSFFRAPQLFDTLKERIFPDISRSKSSTTPLRMWVPGCATRQEAYSLAMALVEYFDDKAVRPPIQIFATDISDPAVLERARAAVYPEGIEAEVTPERLRRFFRKEDHCYRIDKAIRDMCVFARQNVTSDPPFSHVDVITCRNVLIYLSTPLQKRVLPIFTMRSTPLAIWFWALPKPWAKTRISSTWSIAHTKSTARSPSPAASTCSIRCRRTEQGSRWTDSRLARRRPCLSIFVARPIASCLGATRPRCSGQFKPGHPPFSRPYQRLHRSTAGRADEPSAQDGARRIICPSARCA
jgi:chemotaxis methyl-accepting protein methylase